jgi:hypothetical protein
MTVPITEEPVMYPLPAIATIREWNKKLNRTVVVFLPQPYRLAPLKEEVKS